MSQLLGAFVKYKSVSNRLWPSWNSYIIPFTTCLSIITLHNSVNLLIYSWQWYVISRLHLDSTEVKIGRQQLFTSYEETGCNKDARLLPECGWDALSFWHVETASMLIECICVCSWDNGEASTDVRWRASSAPAPWCGSAAARPQKGRLFNGW